MARPVNADSAATQKRLVDAACETYARRGYEQSSLRMIAETAGVSLGTISHYFDGKEDLFNAVCDRMLQETAELLPELTQIMKTMPVEEAVAPIINRIYWFGMSHRSAVRLILRGVMERGTFPKRFQDRGQFPVIPLAAKLLHDILGLEERRARLYLHQWSILIGRLVAMDDAEATLIVPDSDDPRKEIVQGLIDSIRSQLLPYAKTARSEDKSSTQTVPAPAHKQTESLTH